MNSVCKFSLLVFAFLILICPLKTVHAANVPQTVEMITIDVQKLSTGYRLSKIIGSSIVNDSNDTIGKIDDVIINPSDNKSAYAILSVGGWLGMGSHMIAVPFENLHISSNRITLPGATKDGVKSLPEFKYRT